MARRVLPRPPRQSLPVEDECVLEAYLANRAFGHPAVATERGVAGVAGVAVDVGRPIPLSLPLTL